MTDKLILSNAAIKAAARVLRPSSCSETPSPGPGRLAETAIAAGLHADRRSPAGGPLRPPRAGMAGVTWLLGSPGSGKTMTMRILSDAFIHAGRAVHFLETPPSIGALSAIARADPCDAIFIDEFVSFHSADDPLHVLREIRRISGDERGPAFVLGCQSDEGNAIRAGDDVVVAPRNNIPRLPASSGTSDPVAHLTILKAVSRLHGILYREGPLDRHIDALDAVARSCGYRDWHAAQGRARG